jgi:hypothetical protein
MTIACHILGLAYFTLGLIHHATGLYQIWRERQKSDQA